MALTTILERKTYNGFTYDSSYGGYTYGFSDVTFTIALGETYIVEWDDKSYTCVAQDMSAMGEGVIGLGNLASYGGTGNNEEFAMGYIPQGVTFLAINDTEPTPHSVAIYQGEVEETPEESDGIVIKDPTGGSVTYGEYDNILLTSSNGNKLLYSKLPEVTDADNGKVLGVVDGIWDKMEAKITDSSGDSGGGTASEVYWNNIVDKPFGEVSGVTIFDGEFEFIYDESDGLASEAIFEDQTSAGLTVGETYTYTWDGQTYESECALFSDVPIIGNTGLFSGIDNGHPVIIAYDGNGSMIGFVGWLCMILNPPADATSNIIYTCKITGSVINKLDSKYIGEIPWANITDKPFGLYPAGTVVIDETIICGSSTSGGDYGIAMSTTVKGKLIQDGVNYLVTMGSEEYSGSYSYDIDFGSMIEVVDSNGTAILQICEGDIIYTDSATFPNGTEYNLKATSVEEIIVKIDSEYLPEGTGTGGSGSTLPEVSTSDAGKFLRVSTDGLWAAETIPSAEGASF